METALHIAKDADELAADGAEYFLRSAKESVRTRNRFTAAISGGSSPRGMHRLLAREPFLSEMPWSQTHLFWVDERLLPYDHPESNFGTAREDFLSRIPIPEANLSPMPVDLGPADGAGAYRRRLADFFGPLSLPKFDLIVLGLGPDGHTASLFPGSSPGSSGEAPWVIAVHGGNPNVARLTLNYNVLNSARNVGVLVSGSGKADMVRRIYTREPPMLPAHYVEPTSGSLTWLLDRAAASLLPERGGHDNG
ncbi:6-phosphogluconolactonase (EC, eukaryotic type [Olavius algarvensis associated proteobacterium Delta 3]|nr:6-phosphogluconolactonase (EC, eukaryotic type [Olavius algarvensis associated proteobacterium Delta 3]CAB5155777.1 6-phosphogluconolactonase (EC, eukaryotic type [Olavius algarvensis associated proteobacterium Delta 3]